MLIRKTFFSMLILFLGFSLQQLQAQVTGYSFGGVDVLGVFYNNAPGNPALMTMNGGNSVAASIQNTNAFAVTLTMRTYYDGNGDGTFLISELINSTTMPIAASSSFVISVNTPLPGPLVNPNMNEDIYVGFTLGTAVNPVLMSGGEVSGTLMRDGNKPAQQLVMEEVDWEFNLPCLDWELHGPSPSGYRLRTEYEYNLANIPGLTMIGLKYEYLDPVTGLIAAYPNGSNFTPSYNIYQPFYQVPGNTTTHNYHHDMSIDVIDFTIEEYYPLIYAYDASNTNNGWYTLIYTPLPGNQYDPVYYHSTRLNPCDATGAGGGEEGGRLGNLDSPAEQGITLLPNPAHDQSQLHFTLQEAQQVSITLLDLNGQVVQPRVQQTLKAGPQQYTLDMSELSAGIYLTQVQFQDRVEHIRLVKL